MLATVINFFRNKPKHVMTEIEIVHATHTVGHGNFSAQSASASIITSAARNKRKVDTRAKGCNKKRKCQKQAEDKTTPGSENQGAHAEEQEPENGDHDSSCGGKQTGFLGAVFSPVYLVLQPGDRADGSEIPGDGERTDVEPEDEGHTSSDDTALVLSNIDASENVAPVFCQPMPSNNVEEDEHEDDTLDFDPFVFIRNLPPLELCIPKYRSPLLPKQTRQCKRKTLVLDLDETLVHSSLEAVVQPDFTFVVHFNNQEHLVRVRERPHLKTFMERCAQLFEVVVFTASQKVYAEKLLSIIDPDRRLVKHKIYRDSCVIVEGNYLKDLSILGRDLRHTVIVDNSPQAFGFQVENGIPIESWYDDDADEELLKLLPFLESLVDEEDVRPVIEQKFRLKEYIQRC